MQKVGVSKLVDFRRLKNEGPKLTFLKNLQKPKPENNDGGGDYWICSTSAAASTFWNRDKTFLDHKITELREKIATSKYKPTKNQFQKNVDILVSMHDFDFDDITPSSELQKQSLTQNTIEVKGISIQVRPQHIFTFEQDNQTHVGGVWFVAKKGGYDEGELGMFTKALFQYLNNRFSEDGFIDPDYCIAIDISSIKEVRYKQLLKGEVPNLLEHSLIELRSLLN